MTITRYTRRSPSHAPWIEVEEMGNRLNRLFGEHANGEGSQRSGWRPSVNVEENSEELLLTAELPGMSIEAIEIEVENSVLTLKGEKEEKREESDDRRYHLRERRYGAFKRTFNLPRTVRTEEITANVKDGILIVRMPKAPEAKSRKISVESEA